MVRREWRVMYLSFLKSLLRHKWYVFKAGVKLGGIPIWRLIIHDWSKFLPKEFIRYARFFHGNYQTDEEWKRVAHFFDYAWLNHQNTNPHHEGYWIIRTSNNDRIKILEMPKTYVREMVADWLGSSYAYTGSWDMTDWLNKNLGHRAKIMHGNTVLEIMHILSVELGYKEYALTRRADE
jgi:hypothetical protein